MAVSVNVTDLKNQATRIVRHVEKGSEYVVTKRGRPVAMILPISLDEDELADWVITHHPEAIRRREAAERRIAAGQFVTGDELRALLARPRRRVKRGR